MASKSIVNVSANITLYRGSPLKVLMAVFKHSSPLTASLQTKNPELFEIETYRDNFQQIYL